jgi:hypothetical protein
MVPKGTPSMEISQRRCAGTLDHVSDMRFTSVPASPWNVLINPGMGIMASSTACNRHPPIPNAHQSPEVKSGREPPKGVRTPSLRRHNPAGSGKPHGSSQNPWGDAGALQPIPSRHDNNEYFRTSCPLPLAFREDDHSSMFHGPDAGCLTLVFVPC